MDIRWKQRLENFELALRQLQSAVQLAQSRLLSDLEKQGLIQSFEFTHELAWNLMKDYAVYQGGGELITGSRDASRDAFQRGLIADGALWMEMIQSRNLTSHTYNQSVAEEISQKIQTQYVPAFVELRDSMQALSKK